MAGSVGESADNPVPMNVVPLIDIIFCLCIFFMCSFHFKQLEGKIESWLPTDKGSNVTEIQMEAVLDEVRIIMTYNVDAKQVELRLGGAQVSNLGELEQLVDQSLDDYERAGKDRMQVPVIIDAMLHVPWRDVVQVMNVCHKRKWKLEFAQPLPGQ